MILLDHPFYVALQEHMVKHAEAYTEGAVTACTALFISAWCCAPQKWPTSWQEWWAWIRDTFQTAIPAARRHDPPNPQPQGETK